MIMTRDKDDDKELWNKLGSKEYRKELDRQFKMANRTSKSRLSWICG